MIIVGLLYASTGSSDLGPIVLLQVALEVGPRGLKPGAVVGPDV